MPQYNRLMWRVASIIHHGLKRNQQFDVPLPDSMYLKIQKLHRQIELAVQNGWQKAAHTVRTKYLAALKVFREQIVQLEQDLYDSAQEQLLFTQKEIYQDLIALAEEFPEVTIDLSQMTLGVTTQDIQLEEIAFGAFAIVVDLSQLLADYPYEVLALDPNPAITSEETTHPHVQVNGLCEGAGKSAIRTALLQGRLFDFFMLVNQVLETYNPLCAYVELSDWNGFLCEDCGMISEEISKSVCSTCDSKLCEECVNRCEECKRKVCHRCQDECGHCRLSFCPDCVGQCGQCERSFCKECLDDETCSKCKEEQGSQINPVGLFDDV